MTRTLIACFALLLACNRTAPETDVAPTEPYGDVAAALERFIDHELRDKRIPAASIALVDDQDIVWARGFGFADPDDSVPATAATVHRVGSVSKLFTDFTIMQLVERGQLDLDAPVTRYIPAFRPLGEGARTITLRHLMAHRAGLMREPPVGNYFDPDGSTLAAMVESLNHRDLLYTPGTRTKYSNAGIGLAGYIVQRTQGRPFDVFLEQAVLERLGMRSSSFSPRPDLVDRLARASMWTQDGRVFPAPTFELGMTPAGSMYSTALDLGRFITVLFDNGRPLLRPGTLDSMLTPQFAEPGATTGFGIGFALSELDGHRRIGHGGAIYGFATDLAALPDDKLGVVVILTLDIANPVAERISAAALRMMLAARQGRPLPAPIITDPVDTARARRLAGRYARVPAADAARVSRTGVRGDEGMRYLDLIDRHGQLFLLDDGKYALRARGDTLIVDDRRAFGGRVLPLDSLRIVIGRDTLLRVPAARPAPPPERWNGVIGEYGWDHNTLYILEKDGRLHALIEWFFQYPLDEVGTDVFRFPARGLYDAEDLVFSRGPDGRATSVEAAGVTFPRRDVGTEAGTTFRITPVRPVAELRTEAMAASPPAETGEFRASDLVELQSPGSGIRYDIRYASTDNFMGEVFYTEPRALLQRPAAEATRRAHQTLRANGYGLLIHDAYRPWFVTKMFWDATPQDMKQFVANPASGSRHNRGAAVDLTLYHLATGRTADMVSGYDEFSPRAFPDYPGGTSLQRWHRELLRNAMEREGFTVYEWEWWHFDFDGWRNYRIGNTPFGR